jgi:hypothetical protein
MTARRKPPAYGAALMRERRAGTPVACVHFLLGDDWSRRERLACPIRAVPPRPHPALALRPREYAPGVYDFAAVTGLWVALTDADGTAATDAFWSLAGELGAHAARLAIYSPLFDRPLFADELALALRDWGAAGDPTRNHGWPRWWSAEIDRKHAERRLTWLQAGIERELERA